jgi:hypothetical protein
MKKRVADRGVAWVCVLAGAVMVAGCSDLTNSPPGRTEAGVTDGGGKVDGKSGSSGGKKDAGSSNKAGNSGSSSISVGGAEGGAGGSSPVGGQSSSSSSSSSDIDAGVDAPVGGSSGGSNSVAGSGGASVVGGSSGGSNPPQSSGGSNPPQSSGGTAGSNSRDAGYDLKLDTPVSTVCTTAASCPAPTSGNGTAVCQGGNCSITCNNGYHRCGNACVANDSPANCGSSCSACTSPASNGTATCSGNPLACGVKCDLGFHACGSSCVVDGSTSMNSCGNTCAACKAPTNGSATCNGRSCVQSCNNGYHLCNGTCLPNNSVEGCGTASCTPCRVPANGAPTCNGTSCGFECNSNYHKCGSNCASNTDPNNCGTTCKVCPGDLNGTAACVAGDCTINCKTGYHWCDNTDPPRCVADNSTSTASCGRTCEICQVTAGTRATCDGTKCGKEIVSCLNTDEILCNGSCLKEDVTRCGSCTKKCTEETPPAGTHWTCQNSMCTPVCTEPTKPETCGASCLPCPVPENSNATCTGTPPTCGSECLPTAHRCASGTDTTTCHLNDDFHFCGTECADCPEPSNSVRSCNLGKCEFTCVTTYHLCENDAENPCYADGVDCPPVVSEP